jgi:HPt (histidine-containing phosphotransfer) domain-containing protein
MQTVEAPLDVEKALCRLEQDRDLLLEVLGSFVESTPDILEEIRVHARDGDMPAVQTAAHGLKGAAANINAEPTRRVAERLEIVCRRGEYDQLEAVLADLDSQVARVKDFIGKLS